METFEVILLMLSAVFLSNILGRFLPNIAIPLVQVGLGILLTLLLEEHSITLSPELFLLLFMAPLLFNDGSNTDKKSLWEQKKSIFSLSIGLVFLTVFVVGYFIHLLLPSIPLAAAFALAAALAPTDAVAVSALAEKVNVPHKIMHILEGESLINDASGLVSFQFAVLAIMTGAFSITNAATSFLMLSIGGIILGAVITLVKIFLMRWLRQHGLENNTSFMLMEILLPFLIFMIAEHVGVNGILAVVTGGIVHSISYKRLNPEVAQLNLLSKNTWVMITFTLNGLVFILLGTQIPEITHVIWENEEISKGSLFLYILSITSLILFLRFLWVLCFPTFKLEPYETWKSHMKNILLYTISGVRGTITLVSSLSLPLILGNGETFAERDLLIFIAAGVIIVTLLVANFTLPLFAPKKESKEKSLDHTIEVHLLREVIEQLLKYQTEENKASIKK